MGEHTRDPHDWLRKFSPAEWIRAALGELRRATNAFERGDLHAAAAGVKRAAGMALNAALLVEPNESWGRTYVEHLSALSTDPGAPEAVRGACRTVLEAKVASAGMAILRTPRAHDRELEATRDVIAHAWAVVKRHESAEG
jgi:HEPN domain-containing protein